jgi:hypothetical protein
MKLAVLFLFFLPLISLNADSILDDIQWSFRGNLLYFAANTPVDADPAPILPSLGASAAYQFFGPLRIELTCDIYFTNYEYNFELGRAFACNPENRSALVFGFITAAQLTLAVPIGQNGTVIRIYGGPAIDFRIAILALGLIPQDLPDAREQTNAIRRYFWSNGRWFMPVAGVGMDFPVNERFLLGFDFRTWFPLYAFGTSNYASPLDGWRFGAGIRITSRPRSEAHGGEASNENSE